MRNSLIAAAVLGVAVMALAVTYVLNNRDSTDNASGGNGVAGKYAFQVGNPGPGKPAPPIKLPSTDGSTFDLGALRGQTILLYFQEGVMCQPCWNQIKDIEKNWGQFQALGIDRLVSITTDPLAALKQKVADERLATPILSDPNLAVSRPYEANKYGMMGDSMDGHSFVLVGKDGTILWRADYGGAPKYTMFVPVSNLVADLQAGLGGTR